MIKIDKNKYYTPNELAERYNVNTRTIARLIGRGELSALRIGRQLRIKGLDLIVYEDSHKTGLKE